MPASMLAVVPRTTPKARPDIRLATKPSTKPRKAPPSAPRQIRSQQMAITCSHVGLGSRALNPWSVRILAS